MEIMYWRILFFCLIPIGIFLLVKGIRLVRKTLNGTVLLEIPYLQKTGQFTVVKAGYFSIWQKGSLRKQTPINQFKPYIVNDQTNELVKLSFSLMRPQVNGFSVGRMEICSFFALPGNYRLELREGSSVSKLEGLLTKVAVFGKVDLTKYFIQIRASQFFLLTILAVIVIVLGALGVIGGLILGLLADQIVGQVLT